MTKKKVIRNFGDENRKFFREKVKCYKFSKESKIFSKTWGKSETGGKCIMVSGGDGRPLNITRVLSGSEDLQSVLVPISLHSWHQDLKQMFIGQQNFISHALLFENLQVSARPLTRLTLETRRTLSNILPNPVN